MANEMTRTCCGTPVNAEHHLDCPATGMPAMHGLGEQLTLNVMPKPYMSINITPGEMVVDYGVQGQRIPMSPQAERVTKAILEALLLFLKKNPGYGDTAYVLGARGQYADMNRKMGKLKHTLWDGHEAVGESVVEMLQDLIGHAGLTIDFIQQEGN